MSETDPSAKRSRSTEAKAPKSKSGATKSKRKRTFARGVPRSTLRQRDPYELYETPEVASRALIAHEPLLRGGVIWEPCCGRGAISSVLTAAGLPVISTDVIDRGFGCGGVDFFSVETAPDGVVAIVTNPPYGRADDFVRHALRLAPAVLVLLRWQYAEGKGKSDLIDGHLDHVWLGVERLPMMHRDGYDGPKLDEAGTAFGWFRFMQSPRVRGEFSTRRISWGRAADNKPPTPSFVSQPSLGLMLEVAP